jgi:hypothetical protein
MRVRGFTLMEAAVTLAIGIIVLFAAAQLQVLVTKTYTSARRVSELSDRVVSLSSYLAKELATVGGNAAGTAASIYVEHNCAARGSYNPCPNGSDRITLFAAVSKLPACTISHIDSTVTPPRISFWYRDAANTPRCCFNDEKNGTRDASGAVTQYLKRHAILVQGTFHKAVLLIGEEGAPGETTAPAPLSYLDWDRDADGEVDSRCTFRMVDVMRPGERFEPPTPDGWRNGTGTIVDMRALYIDDRPPGQPPRLVMHTDLDQNGNGASPTTVNAGTGAGGWNWSDSVSPPVDETLTIMDGVYDLQLVMGFDLDDDGLIATTEWNGDVSGEVRDYTQDRRLRLLRLDAVLGVKVTGLFQGNSVPTPARTGGTSYTNPDLALRAMSVTVMPRNTDSLLAGVD